MRGLIGAALCLLAAAPARAGVVVRPDVPFTATQLEEAIGSRAVGEDARGAAGGELAVEVSRVGPERLALTTPAGRWEIEIGAARGETAARVVALYVVELGGAAVPAAPTSAPSAGAAVPSAGAAVPSAVAAVPGAHAGPPGETAAATVQAGVPAGAGPGPARYRISVLGVGTRGAESGDFASVGGALEVARTGRWLAGGGIAWLRGLAIARDVGAPIDADLLRARAGGGVAMGPIELAAGGFAGVISVDSGPEVIQRAALGLWAEARVVVPVSDAWSLVIATSAEVFRHRIEVRLGETPLGATPRATLGGGVGLAWRGGAL